MIYNIQNDKHTRNDKDNNSDTDNNNNKSMMVNEWFSNILKVMEIFDIL